MLIDQCRGGARWVLGPDRSADADPGQVRIEQVQDRGPADGSTVVGWGEHGLDAAALLVDQRVNELGCSARSWANRSYPPLIAARAVAAPNCAIGRGVQRKDLAVRW